MNGFVTGRNGEERLHPVDMVVEGLASPFAEELYGQKNMHALTRLGNKRDGKGRIFR